MAQWVSRCSVVVVVVVSVRAVIAHYLVAHGIHENSSHDIRYALYYRVSSTELDPERVYSEPWLGWAL